jgi:hypothetical protein
MGELTTQDLGIFRHDLPSGTCHPNRETALIDLTRGERVIHVGCTDWPLTRKKLDDGTLLHKALLQATADVHGVDIDEAGIENIAVPSRRQLHGGRLVHRGYARNR